MATNDDMKGLLALIAIVVFIIIGVYWGFGWTSFVLLIGFLIVLSVSGAGKEMQTAIGTVVLLSGFIYFVVLGAFGAVTANATAYFIFLTFCIAPHLELKNAVALVGFVLLSVFIFGAGVTGYLVFIFVFAFVYATLEDTTYGAIMLVPLLIVGWFVGSGWAATVEQKVSGISTQVSATTGISTDVVGSKITSVLNDTWLLFTDPNKWYEKQFVEKGTRDTGMTPSALEITKIEALPNTVMPKDTFDVVFEMENKGTVDSESVNISANGGTLTAACGKINGKYCLRSCPGGGSLAPSCITLKQLGKLAKKEKRFDSFTFQAPECPGTYTTGGRVIYSYEADATLSLQMIARKYYEELLRNNQMKWIDELSVASAGPFKVTLRTDRQQPIPDRTADDKPQGFKIYLGLINEHEGIAKLSSATLDIPASLELVNYLSEEKIDSKTKETATTYTADESCSITYDATMTEQECRDKAKPSTNKCSDKDTGAVISFQDISIAVKHDDYIKISNAFKDKATNKNNNMVSYKPTILSAEMNQNDWKYYKCGFQLEKDKDKISQIETLFLRTHIDYNFEYTKDTTVTVRQVGGIPAKCQENVKKVSAIDSAQTKPQAKTDIVADLADKIDACWRNSNFWWEEDHLCGSYKVDIAGCSGEIIKGSEVRDKLNEFKSEATKNSVVIYSIANDGTVKPICEIGTAADKTCPSELFNDRQIYINLEVWYIAPTWTPDYIQINRFDSASYLQADTTDCKGKGDVCEGAEKSCQDKYVCTLVVGRTQRTCEEPSK